MDTTPSSPSKERIGLSSKSTSYTPPQEGILSRLPASWVPFAELIRLNRPIGIIIIHCPFLLGTLFAAAVSQPRPPLYTLLDVESKLFVATVFLRGSMVAFNDLADREIDSNIARTQHRPLARKAISPFEASLVVLVLTAVWLAILAWLSSACLIYAVPSLALAAFYPYSKRFLDFTPVVLGLTMAGGTFIGCAAMNVDPITLAVHRHQTSSIVALVTLYLCCATWTTIYECIYAYQDILDDEKHGVNSMAIRLRGRAKTVLSFLAVLQVCLYAWMGWLLRATPWTFGGSCLWMSVSLGTMIWSVDLERPDHCWWWFANGTWLVGSGMIAGLLSQM